MESAIQQTTSSEETSLPIYREAALFEDTRLVTRILPKRTSYKVFLLKVKCRHRQAVLDLLPTFGCAGFDIMDNSGLIMSMTGTALENGADIVVICSSDKRICNIRGEATLLLKKSPLTYHCCGG